MRFRDIIIIVANFHIRTLFSENGTFDSRTEFKKQRAQDLEAGISQLSRAIDLLSAVGADQTVRGFPLLATGSEG